MHDTVEPTFDDEIASFAASHRIGSGALPNFIPINQPGVPYTPIIDSTGEIVVPRGAIEDATKALRRLERRAADLRKLLAEFTRRPS